MILERAQIPVLPGQEENFEQAMAQARGVISQAHGFRSLRFLRGIDSPHSYLLLIEWDTLEDHTEGFRGSELFVQWRALLDPYFNGAPQVEHYDPRDDS
jgi:heme-degrading monooxygenase HmoA